MTPKEALVLNDLFAFLMDRDKFVGTLQDLANAIGHRRGEVATARSYSRSPEHIAEHKWEVTYVGVGTRAGEWRICDLSTPENCEWCLTKRWPDVLEDLRRLLAAAVLRCDATTNGEELKRAIAERKTTEAMVALAETYSR